MPWLGACLCPGLGGVSVPGQDVEVHQGEGEASVPLQLQEVQLLPEEQQLLGNAGLPQQEHVVRPQRELRPRDVEERQDRPAGAQRLIGGERETERWGRETESETDRDRDRETERERQRDG